jgi:hypothetical protein
MRTLPILLLLTLIAGPATAAGEHRLGLGLHYWGGDLDDVVEDGLPEVSDDGVGAVVSWQYVADWLVRFEVDLEVHPDGYAGSDDTTVAPSVFVLLGTGTFYAGAGVGVAVSSDFADDVSDPYWTGRLGIDLHPAPRIHIDVHADYRVDAFADLEEVELDGDLWTVGAMVRFTL